MPDRIIRESALASETLAQLSDFAERLFWRLTTIADDYGRFSANAALLHGRCFALVAGATVKKVEAGLVELGEIGTIRLYEAEGKKFGYFPNWDKYQRGFRGKPKYPEPPSAASCGELPPVAAVSVDGRSPSLSNTNTISSPDLKEGESLRGGDDDPLRPEDLMEAWNEQCRPLGLGEVKELSPARREKLRHRIREHPDPDWWSEVLSKIRGSRFCLGMGTPRNGNGKPWKASFDWMIENDTNALKAYEGKYNNE